MTVPAAATADHAPALAAIHAAAFASAWSAADFSTLLAAPGMVAFTLLPDAFILVRAAGGEAEIITLAVIPAARRKGLATALVRHAAAMLAAQGVSALHLEVGAENQAARALYARLGFIETGRRRAYYRQARAQPDDALLLSLALAPAAGPRCDGFHARQNPV